MPIPVILDCDPGHDDVFAIWLAAGNPELDLRAITTVSGNGYLEHTTHNARVACTVAGITDVPIAAGAAGPLKRKLTPGVWIHGENALGGPVLPVPTVPLEARTAIELIADIVRDSTEKITLIPTGPLTNIAHFVQTYPELQEKIERIIWMGGSTGRGNCGAYAEFNSWADPEAVDVVLKSDIDFTMVGLNITHQALITQDVRARIRAIGNETGAFGAELLEFFCNSYNDVEGMPDGPLHDPVAVALAIDAAVATTIDTRVDVELAGTETAGATCVDLHNMLRREPNARVALELDVNRFWDLVMNAVSALK